MTETDVVLFLCQWLEERGWKIVSKALNQSHSEDIRATKNGAIIIVETKGSRGDPNNPNVIRSEFDSSQIKDHLGKPIVILRLRQNVYSNNLSNIIGLSHAPKVRIILEISLPLSKLLILLAWQIVYLVFFCVYYIAHYGILNIL